MELFSYFLGAFGDLSRHLSPINKDNIYYDLSTILDLIRMRIVSRIGAWPD